MAWPSFFALSFSASVKRDKASVVSNALMVREPLILSGEPVVVDLSLTVPPLVIVVLVVHNGEPVLILLRELVSVTGAVFSLGLTVAVTS